MIRRAFVAAVMAAGLAVGQRRRGTGSCIIDRETGKGYKWCPCETGRDCVSGRCERRDGYRVCVGAWQS